MCTQQGNANGTKRGPDTLTAKSDLQQTPLLDHMKRKCMKRKLILGNDFLQASFLGRRPGWDKTHPLTLQSSGEAFGTRDWFFRRAACQEVHEPPDSEMPINKSLSSRDLRKDVKNASKVSGASVGVTSGREQQNHSGLGARCWLWSATSWETFPTPASRKKPKPGLLTKADWDGTSRLGLWRPFSNC